MSQRHKNKQTKQKQNRKKQGYILDRSRKFLPLDRVTNGNLKQFTTQQELLQVVHCVQGMLHVSCLYKTSITTPIQCITCTYLDKNN